MRARVCAGSSLPMPSMNETSWGTRWAIRKNTTSMTTAPAIAGYVSRRRARANCSFCHFRCSFRLPRTSPTRPDISPARTRLTKTAPNTPGCSRIAPERVSPPSTDSTMAASTSRSRGFPAESRRVSSPSITGTPAVMSCSMWKQNPTRSPRRTRPRPLARPAFTSRKEMRSSPNRASRASRSAALAASIRPVRRRPFSSIALYRIRGTGPPSLVEPAGQVDDPRHFIETRQPLQRPPDPVIGE